MVSRNEPTDDRSDSADTVPLVLVLGTADWNQPIATNQHYVVRELCRDGFARVVFVESMALRRPQLAFRDMKRVLARVRAAVRRRKPTASEWRPQPEGLSVRSPLVLPIHTGIAARINRRILASMVADWAAYRGPKILWAYTPVTYGLENHADQVVYHCVDLLGTVPGIRSSVIDRSERHLADVGATAAATSQVVREHLEQVGFHSVHLWENVADTEVITAADPMSAVRKPGRVIFAGNLAPNKVDFRLLERLADLGLEVCVAGPRAEGGGSDSDEFASMISHGVRYLGMLTLEELARELVQSTVGVVPYVLNEYTKGVSPLKTYEYLAAGLSVVATAIPGVRTETDHIWVESGTSDFVERVLSLATPPSQATIESRVRIADKHSWAGRGGQIRVVIDVAVSR